MRHSLMVVGKSTTHVGSSCGSGSFSVSGRRHTRRRHGLSTTRGAGDVAMASSSVEVSSDQDSQDDPQNEVASEQPGQEEVSVEEKLKAIGFVKYEFDPEESEKLDKM